MSATNYMVLLLILISIPSSLLAQTASPRDRMAECVNILYKTGDLNVIDINRELDPLFYHIGFMARDRGERVYDAMPRFIILRPGHLGGRIRFTVHFGKEGEDQFMGGRFRLRFGEYADVVFDANLERLSYGEYLIDEEAQPKYRLISSGTRKVSFDVPPGVEEIFFDASVPVGGLYFIRDVYFSASARKTVSDPSPVQPKQPKTSPRIVPAPAAPKPVVARPASVAVALDDGTTKKLKALSNRLQASLDELGKHLERAEEKKSGHPKFLEALRGDEKKLLALRKELVKLLENPSGYDW